MTEGSITCPHCHQAFELTTAMSATIEASLREKIEADANKRKVELDARERAIAEKAAATERAKVLWTRMSPPSLPASGPSSQSS